MPSGNPRQVQDIIQTLFFKVIHRESKKIIAGVKSPLESTVVSNWAVRYLGMCTMLYVLFILCCSRHSERVITLGIFTQFGFSN